MPRLKDRVALVTGAAQGIGTAICEEFALEGALVVAIDVQEFEVSPVRNILPYRFDITDTDVFRSCVEDVDAAHGRIDILVNNAAICSYADILHDRPEDWRRTFQVNLDAVYHGSKLVAPIMARRNWGRIINIASVEALQTEGRVGAYVATKGAVISFTRSLAVELAPYGILANALAPGCIHTPMSIVDGVDETETELFRTWYVGQRKIPLARPGRPEEIAKVCVFLASEQCSYVTGHTLVVDGGLSATF